MSERKFYANPDNPLFPYIGDFKFGDTFLASKDGWLWVFPKYLNALFRGVGQVIFCNNPFSGLVILCCLYWADFTVGLATTLAASTAILTAFVFQQDVKNINAGLTTYNSVLVGSVTASLWTPTFGEPLTLKIWAFIMLAAALSVLVNVAIGNLFGSFKQPLPSFTFAFNIVTILLFTVLAPQPSSNSRTSSRNFDESEDRLDISDKAEVLWSGVLRGILLSMGQVYAVNNLEGSILMYFSAMFYSPTVFMMSFVGATVGSVFGLVFAEPPYTTVYDGVWGFNGILAAIAVGGFFFVLTWLSFLTALADVVMAVIIQQALTLAFTPLKLPCFTYPFVLSSIMFLEMSATGNLLYRVPKVSVPEVHKYEYLQILRDKKNMPSTKPGSSRDDHHYNEYIPHSRPFKPSAPPSPPTSIYPPSHSDMPQYYDYLLPQPSGHYTPRRGHNDPHRHQESQPFYRPAASFRQNSGTTGPQLRQDYQHPPQSTFYSDSEPLNSFNSFNTNYYDSQVQGGYPQNSSPNYSNQFKYNPSYFNHR